MRRAKQRHAPVALSGPRTSGLPRPPTRAEVLGKEALETPLPGRLLVLLSRLHRSESAASEKSPIG